MAKYFPSTFASTTSWPSTVTFLIMPGGISDVDATRENSAVLTVDMLAKTTLKMILIVLAFSRWEHHSNIPDFVRNHSR